MSLTTHSLPGFAGDLNGGVGGGDGVLNGGVLLVLGGDGVAGVNCGGGVGLGFGGLTLDPEAAGDSSFKYPPPSKKSPAPPPKKIII